MSIPRYRISISIHSCHSTWKIAEVSQEWLTSTPENWKKLLTHPHCDGFLEAARKEYSDLEKLKSFKKVTRPRDSQIIPVKWVFIYKFDTDGYLMKYKARICVRGDLAHTQQH